MDTSASLENQERDLQHIFKTALKIRLYVKKKRVYQFIAA